MATHPWSTPVESHDMTEPINRIPTTAPRPSPYRAPSDVPGYLDRYRSPHTELQFWARVAFAAIATFIAGAACAIVVLRLGGWMRGLPSEVLLLAHLHSQLPTVLDWIVVALPWLGTNLVFIPVLGPGCWYLWRKRGRPDLATIIAVATIGNYLIGTVLKVVFERPRPSIWLARGEFTGASYPSGHAMAVTSVIGLVAILLYEEKSKVWPVAAWLLLLIATCYSRLYLGVHWPTDVIGGLLAGATWLLGMFWARRTLSRRT